MEKSNLKGDTMKRAFSPEGKIPAGKYKFRAPLKDKLKGELVTKIIDFEVR